MNNYINFELNGVTHKIIIIKECRHSIRCSIGKEIRIRMPHNLSAKDENQALETMQKWLAKKLKNHQATPQLKLDKTLQIFNQQYKITILKKTQKHFSSKLIKDEIIINVPQNQELNLSTLKKEIHKQLINDWEPFIQEKIKELNDTHFQHKINKIKLSLNTHRWGSCSITREIKLSSRLLWCPEEIIDYVCIHELAHLSAMNHSPKFWNIVKRIVPDYKECKKWLRQAYSEYW